MGVTPSWGPFSGAVQAAERLGGFVDAHLGPEVGIAWASFEGVIPLRRPHFDGGTGTCLVVQWNQTPPPPPKPHGLWQNVKALADEAAQAWVQGQMAEIQAEQIQSQALAQGFQSGARAVGRMFNRAVGVRPP